MSSFVSEHQDKKREETKEILTVRDDLISIQMDKIRRQYEDIEKKLSELQSSRGELCRAVIAKDDFAEVVKNSFDVTRRYVLDQVIEYVKTCHQSGSIPFQPGMRSIFKDYEAHQVLWLALGDDDIDEAIKALPDGGLTHRERESKIHEIDEEIEKLRSSLKDEIARVRS